MAVQLGNLSSESKPAVPAATLSKDFMNDRKAAVNQYAPTGNNTAIIVEGVIAELNPNGYSVILEGVR